MNLLAPIKAIKAEYVPLLMVYFTTGLGGLTAVAGTVFTKDIITLGTPALIALGVYTGLPWSIKMVFGSLIDSVKIFGNNRKSYIYLGQFLIFLGILGSVDHASTQYLFTHLGEFTALLITGLLATTGVVLSDIVADVMAIELVEDNDPEKDAKLGMLQVLSRLSLVFGAVIAAALSGPLATHFDTATVFAINLICPILAVGAISLVKLNYVPEETKLDLKLLLGGLAYGILALCAGSFGGTTSVFFVSFTIITIMLGLLLKDSFPKDMIKPFIFAMSAIFLFRVVPSVGPAGMWWYMNDLGFDEDFIGMLRLTSTLANFTLLFFLSDLITKSSIFKTLTILTVVATVVSIPDILIFYGMTGDINPRLIVWLDSAMVGPMGNLAMIPLGILVAKNAPPKKRAVYISLTASLMNIALVGGDVITQWLNEKFTVTRENFENLGELMIYSLSISTVLSIIGTVLLWYATRRK